MPPKGGLAPLFDARDRAPFPLREGVLPLPSRRGEQREKYSRYVSVQVGLQHELMKDSFLALWRGLAPQYHGRGPDPVALGEGSLSAPSCCDQNLPGL